MLRTQGLSYGNEKSLKHSKWEALTVYILDELLCTQCRDGLERSKAGSQKIREGANETVQKPNEEETGKEGKFLNIRDVTEIHNDQSNMEMKEKKE